MTADISAGVKTSTYRSLTQIIVENIRQNIYEGVYEPGGRLNILDLAKEYSASSIPVREALRNLEAEGLVEFRPNRGVVIRELSANEVRELYLMRLPLEILAARQAALCADAADLNPLQAILKRMDKVKDPAKWITLHEQFHHEFYALSRFPRLAQYLRVLRGQMRPYSKVYLADKRHVEKAQSEHYAMLEAARKRDTEALRKIITLHLTRPARIALKAYGANDLDQFDAMVEA